MQGSDTAGGHKDPADVAQRLFESYEERHSQDAPPPAAVIAAVEPAKVDKAELIAVVESLQLVTDSLIATSEALAAIAETLAE
jgi:hypothetical protein